MNKNLIKVLRYSSIYGFRRTIIKIAGRLRLPIIKFIFPELLLQRKKNISLVGCGQFGFSTISFFLLKQKGNRFLDCFDVDLKKSQSTAGFYGYNCRTSASDLLENPDCRYVYIASNHFTHTEYAVKAIQLRKEVYIEKPISVNWEQLKLLLNTIRSRKGKVYAGYNRPFSKAIMILREYLPSKEPFTLNCFIIGHKIEQDHWYRDAQEGTRICGNVGHWLDLAVHLMNSREVIPEIFNISISFSHPEEYDDNISISITTNFNDLINIVLTSRSEPFEGINETIDLQAGGVIAKIDDFRKMTVWYNDKVKKYSFQPKDVGHKNAILQPFKSDKQRDFFEVEISSTLMLTITDMVKRREVFKSVSPAMILYNLIGR